MITHHPRCPEMEIGGSAAGPCLCLKAGLKPVQMPRVVPLVQDVPFADANRRARDRRPADLRHSNGGLTTVQKASQDLAGVGRRWKDAMQWAVDTGHPMAEVLVRSCLRPEVVRDYMASLRTEVAS